jgi:hypothetical protein
MKWAFAPMAIIALVFIYSCSDDEGEPEPEPVDPPEFSYTATTVDVGTTGTLTPSVIGGDATYAITDSADAEFLTINVNTGELSVAAESTVGEYNVVVTGSNAEGTHDATAAITIGINDDFDPTGKNLLWKYWMNYTEDVVFYNLDQLPGQGGLPDEIPIPIGWPGGTQFQIDPMDPALESYLIFPTVQFFLQQVPGDEACDALEPSENGDTLLIIVNSDLTLSTACRNDDKSPGTTVDLGESTISYANGGFVWTLNLTISTIPVPIAIGGAEIADFTDPLDPHWTAPSGTPRTFSAIRGTVENYMTPTDFLDETTYITSIDFLTVDVVFEILQ